MRYIYTVKQSILSIWKSRGFKKNNVVFSKFFVYLKSDIAY